MALPIMNTPTYELVIPSSKKKIKYRPFLVKEEKALLIAQQSDDATTMASTLKGVISACTFEKIDVNSLAMFDIEYIFCQLRAKSVGEISELAFNCLECNDPKGKITVNIDLTKVDVKLDPNHTTKIDLFDDVGVTMKYPDFELINKLKNVDENDMNAVFDIIVQCIDSIYTDDQIYAAIDSSKEELTSFLDNLTQEQFAKIQNFFETMPRLEHTIEFDCPNCGFHHKHVLQGLDSFF